MKANICSISGVFFMLIFCPALVPGQNDQLTRHIENYLQDNGKYITTIFSAYHTEEQTPDFRRFGNERGTVNRPLKASQGNPAQTYHIKFNFDAPYEILYCNGADTVFISDWNMVSTGSYSIEADMTEGYYLIYCNLLKMNPSKKDTLFLIYQKDFHVYKNLDTNISRASAIHDLSLIAIDESGVQIETPKKAGDGFGMIHEFGDGYKGELFNSISTGAIDPVFKISDLNPDIKVIFGKSNILNKEDIYHQYLISYPAITVLYSDTTLSYQAQDLSHFPLVYHPSPSYTDSYFAFGYGTVFNDSLMGSANSFVGAWITDDYPGKNDTIEAYVYGTACDTNKAFFASLVSHREYGPVTLCYLHDIFGPIFYLDPSGTLILSAEGNYPPVDGDYPVDNENVVQIGTTAPYNVSWDYTEPGSCMLDIWQHFEGQFNERRNSVMMLGTWDIWKGNEHQWHDSITYYQIAYGVPTPGIYTLVLNDSNYLVCGKDGYLRVEMTMDVGGTDAASPTLQAFKIMMGDSIRSEIIHGFPAHVRLTAADLVHLPPSYTRVYHTIAEVRLYLKEYDDTTWMEVPVTPQTYLLDSLCGMPYDADIEQPLSHFPDSTFIDFKVELIDSAGNSTVQIMHPA